MEKKIVISKLARLDAPDFMSTWFHEQWVCVRVVVMWCESKKSNNNQRIETEGDAIGHLLNVYINPVLLTAQCVNWFFYSAQSFFFVLLNFLIFYSLIIRICWVRAVFSSSSYFSSAFYFFSSRVFRWTLRIFQLREKAHNFSFILSSHSAVVIVVAAATFLSSHSVALAHSTFDSLTYRHPSHVSHFVITLVEFIVNYCCLNIYLFFYLSGIFRLEQHS